MKISSRLTPEELLIKIKSGTKPDKFLLPQTGYWEILGKFRDNKFRLHVILKYKKILLRPYFYGKVVKTENGSEIIGKFRLHPLEIIFMSIWFAAAGFGCLICFLQTKSWEALIPFWAIAFGFLMMKAFQWFGRGSEEHIIIFLNKCANSPKNQLA